MASPPSMVSAVTASPSTGSEPEAPCCDPQLAAVTAERKRKRKESNRLSAQRSRARKQQQLDDLTKQVAALRARNGAMAAAAYDVQRRCAAVFARIQRRGRSSWLRDCGGRDDGQWVSVSPWRSAGRAVPLTTT